MAGIFNAAIFNNSIFNTGGIAPETPPSGGKGDNEHRLPFKPTGLLDRPRKSKDKGVEARLESSREIAAEVAAEVAAKLVGEVDTQLPPVATMSMLEIEREIGLRLREKARKEEEEIMCLLLMVVAAA